MKPGAIFAEHYRVLSQLGVGGMGEVYLVENVRLGRREALKLLHTTGDDEAVARFEREARTAARLGHPSIADIYHYGTTDSGRPWFTMVYVEGTDLTKATLTDAEAITVLRSVSEAIDYAHDQHVVHRDIKPANLMVSRNRSGRIDRAYVLDFGIARPEGDPRITHANMYIGTVAYSAPETFSGDAVGASDVYSLACTAFELLSAKTPFQAETVTQLMIAIATWPPAKLSQYRDDLASADPVFERALAKKPMDRYASCAEFVDALERSIQVAPNGGASSATFPAQAPRTSGTPVAGPHGIYPPVHNPTAQNPAVHNPTGQLGYGHAQGGTLPYSANTQGGFQGGQATAGTYPLGAFSGEQPPGSSRPPGKSRAGLAWLVGIGVLALIAVIVAVSVAVSSGDDSDTTTTATPSSSSASTGASTTAASSANLAGTIDSTGYVHDGSATGTPRSCRWIRVIPLATAQTGTYGKMSSEIVNQLGCINLKQETVISRCKELMPNESGYCAFWDPQGVLSGQVQSGRPLLVILRKTCLDRENKTKWSAGPISDDCITYPKQS